MAEKTLIAKMRTDESDPETLLVTSPVVGMADGAPKDGLFLNPFDRIITMNRAAAVTRKMPVMKVQIAKIKMQN